MKAKDLAQYKKAPANSVTKWLETLPSRQQLEVVAHLRQHLSDPLECARYILNFSGAKTISYLDVQAWCAVAMGTGTDGVIGFNKIYEGLGPDDLLKHYAFSCYEVQDAARAYVMGVLPESHPFQRFNPNEISNLVKAIAPPNGYVAALKQWDALRNRAQVQAQALDYVGRMRSLVMGNEAIRDTQHEALIGHLWDIASEILEQEILDNG